MTSKAKQPVNLFLIAPMRSGSTSMFHYLAKHPDISECPIKEPNYFVDSLPDAYFEPSPWFDINKYVEKDTLNPVHIARVSEPEHYEQLFKQAGHARYRMEASTSYWLMPEACQKIKTYNPDSKIVLLVRDPIERLYSHYRIECGLGRERRSFMDAIADELQQLKAGILPAYSYIGLSQYDRVINRFESAFHSVELLRLEEVTENVPEFSQQITAFLKIDPFPEQPFLHLNKSRKVLNTPLYRMMIDSGIKDYLRLILGKSLRRSLYKAFSKANPPVPKELKDLQSVQAHLREASSRYYEGIS